MDRAEIERITDYIFLEDEDKTADIALVFGTRFWHYPLREVQELYQSDSISKVVFSGGINRHTGKNEAQKLAREALRSAIKENDIIIEDRSRNTLENVLFSRDILSQKMGLENIHSIVAIVKSYHSRRALMTMRRHFPEHIVLKSCTYPIYNITKDNWHLSASGREKVSGELEKIEAYLTKGDLAEL